MTKNLHDLINITPQIADDLKNVGVFTAEDFTQLGGEKAYQMLTEGTNEPNDELYFRLLGAELGTDWHIIAERDAKRAASRFAETDEP